MDSNLPTRKKCSLDAVVCSSEFYHYKNTSRDLGRITVRLYNQRTRKTVRKVAFDRKSWESASIRSGSIYSENSGQIFDFEDDTLIYHDSR
jgi:hypothetical protein